MGNSLRSDVEIITRFMRQFQNLRSLVARDIPKVVLPVCRAALERASDSLREHAKNLESYVKEFGDAD